MTTDPRTQLNAHSYRSYHPVETEPDNDQSELFSLRGLPSDVEPVAIGSMALAAALCLLTLAVPVIVLWKLVTP